MKEIIKKFCEEQCKADEAFKAVYAENRLDDCIKYLYSQAKKKAKNNMACIEDSVVYKWVRDFFYNDIEEPAETTTITDDVENEELEVKPATVITTKKEKKSDEQYQMSLFD